MALAFTALEAIQAAKPVIIFDSEHNRESSALPYLNSVKSKDGPSGIYPIETNEYIFSALEKVILDKKFCQAVVRNQAEMLAKLQGAASSLCQRLFELFLGFFIVYFFAWCLMFIILGLWGF